MFLLASLNSFAFSVYAPDNTWSQNEVRVCFAPGESAKRTDLAIEVKVINWSKSKREKVRKWVEEEYTPERTGIHFVGWESCADDPKADVVMFTSPVGLFEKIISFKHIYYGLATIGTRLGTERIKGYPDAQGILWLSDREFSKSVTVHEFGHIAGLAHEHDRIEAFKDPGCTDKDVVAGGIASYTSRSGEYDPDSVMNYCKILQGGVKKDIGLSQADIRLLQKMYRVN